MRVFVTGASGFIASAVVPELLAAGHEVTGLARSDAAAAAVASMGAQVRRGDLGDLAGLQAAAADADAVIHLAFRHDAMTAGDFAGAVATDLAVVQALGAGLAGPGTTFIGIGVLPTGDPQRDAVIEANPRSAVTRVIAGLAGRGVRTVLVAIPPVTHGGGDRHGFIPTLIRIAGKRARPATSATGPTAGPPAMSWTWATCTGWRWRRPRPGPSCSPQPRKASPSARSPRTSGGTWASRR
jgi:nucleoside-diphosphate-sugar epimerase